jgi:hypothetical protein
LCSGDLAPGLTYLNLVVELRDRREPEIGVLGGESIADGKDQRWGNGNVVEEGVERGKDGLISLEMKRLTFLPRS